MLLIIVDFLKNQAIKFPAVFSYTSTRMILAALTSLIVSIALGPWFIRKLYELKIGQPIRQEECPILGALHRNKNNTPTMGGVLILFSMAISLFLWMDWSSIFTWILLATTLIFGVLGGVDDYLKLKYKNAKGLSGKKKMAFQILYSLLLTLYFFTPSLQEGIETHLGISPPIIKEEVQGSGTLVHLEDYVSRVYLPFLKGPWLSLGAVLTFLFIAFVISGASNAVNLTDGLDGLASGCLVMVAAVLAIFAFVSNHIEIAHYLNILYIGHSGEIAIYLLAMIGAVLGFLWYNGHPAQLFMGDTGSLTLGALIGVCAVLLRKEFLLAIIGGIFVVEALSVMIQVVSFKLRKERVFLCAPLHHHFEYKGWPETKVVTRFWIISLLLALLGLASLKFQ